MAEHHGSTGRDVLDDQSFDALHWALSDRQRVATIAFLRRHQTATASELAERIARQRDGDPESLELSLARHHLPVMADAGLVEYDEGEKSVALADLSPAASEHVERALDER